MAVIETWFMHSDYLLKWVDGGVYEERLEDDAPHAVLQLWQDGYNGYVSVDGGGVIQSTPEERCTAFEQGEISW